jgi:hypothetical protein
MLCLCHPKLPLYPVDKLGNLPRKTLAFSEVSEMKQLISQIPKYPHTKVGFKKGQSTDKALINFIKGNLIFH